jgi:predicted MPP superfamily phosphohydrolase
MNSPFIFVAFMAIVWTILFLVHWVAYTPYARVFELNIPYWPVILGTLSFSYFLANIGVRIHKCTAFDYFYFIAATWLGFIFLLFSASLVYELVHLTTGFDSKLVLGGLLAIVITLSVYALIQGRALVVEEYTVPVANLEEPLRIVHLSDIHVGTVHQTQYLEQIVRKTSALKPDLVLVTGDLFDGSAPIDEEMLTPLNKLAAPSFFSNGNHEEYEGLMHVQDTIKNLDLHLLDNEVVKEKGIQIVGVNDRQSLPRDQKLGDVLDSLELSPHTPTLLMYHSPVEWADARAHGVDLMLSGHTHNGQIYPFNLLVRIFFKYVNGLYEEEGKHLHVSPGTGTWGPPMRLGSRNQITVLELVGN